MGSPKEWRDSASASCRDGRMALQPCFLPEKEVLGVGIPFVASIDHDSRANSPVCCEAQTCLPDPLSQLFIELSAFRWLLYSTGIRAERARYALQKKACRP